MIEIANATIIDVLENVLGDLAPDRVNLLTAAELEELAGAVNAFYAEWQAPPLCDDELRVYSGGWIAGNTLMPEARDYLYTSLLYAPTAVLHDPVAGWFDPARGHLQAPPAIRGRTGMQIGSAEAQIVAADGYYAHHQDLERSRGFLTHAISELRSLAPLIRQGIVIPIPQWRIVRSQQQAILAAVRHDVKDHQLAALISQSDESPPRSDHLRGMEVTPDGGVTAADALRAQVQNPAYFLNKTLAIGAATSSTYVPPATIDAALFAHRLRKTGEESQRRGVHLRVLGSLAATDLPFLSGLDAQTLVAIRGSEQAFADWRAQLRMIARTVRFSPADGDAFVEEARDVMADALGPRGTELAKVVSRSAVMRAAGKEQLVSLTVGAAAAGGAAAVLGAHLDSAALVELGFSTVGRWVWSGVFGSRAVPAHGVLATLVRRHVS